MKKKSYCGANMAFKGLIGNKWGDLNKTLTFEKLIVNAVPTTRNGVYIEASLSFIPFLLLLRFIESLSIQNLVHTFFNP